MDGKRLKELRKKKGYSLDKLSERTGISKSYLSLIERDIQSNPSLDILNRIAKTFEIEVEELVWEEKEVITGGTPVPDLQIKSSLKIEIVLPLEDLTPQKLEQIHELIKTLKEV